MFDLSDKVVLVTGGAGLLGRMHSEAIVANGGKVIVGDIDIESAERTCREINELYSPVGPGFSYDPPLEKAFPIYLNVLILRLPLANVNQLLYLLFSLKRSSIQSR